MVANWSSRLIAWLHEANQVWFAILTIPLVFMFCWSTISGWEPRVRVTGMLLELMGLGTVAYGVRETRKLFGRRGLIEIAHEWLKRFPRLRVETRVVLGAGAFSLGGAAVTGFVTVSPSPSASLEERVSALEKGLERANLQIHETQMKIEKEAGRRTSALESERREREAGDEKNEELLREAAAGGLYLEATGVFWLVFGVVFATASNEIAGLFTRN